MVMNTRLLKMMPLTLALMAISIVVTVVTVFGRNAIANPLFISSDQTAILPEVLSGQLWRLVTPIFLHFNEIHIVFNMLALFFIGQAIEIVQKSSRLATLVFITAVLSNLAEYFWSGPGFGGMSGVVYGLVGYLWIQARFNPFSGFMLNQQMMIIVMIWFVLCWVGIIPSVANMAHTAGLLMGALAGWYYLPRFRRA